MKRTRKSRRDELKPEYDFDYSKARLNPYAALLKDRSVAVVLEPDVAAAFPSSKAVNKQLRAVLAAIPRRSKRAAVRARGSAKR